MSKDYFYPHASTFEEHVMAAKFLMERAGNTMGDDTTQNLLAAQVHATLASLELKAGD